MNEDTNEIHLASVACHQPNIKTCQYRNYECRLEYELDYIKLTRESLPAFKWLLLTYVCHLLTEGKSLLARCPLLTGSRAAMHGERISVRYTTVSGPTVTDWQDHILNLPDRVR